MIGVSKPSRAVETGRSPKVGNLNTYEINEIAKNEAINRCGRKVEDILEPSIKTPSTDRHHLIITEKPP